MWISKDQKKIISGGRYSVLEKKLVIFDAREEDAGLYICNGRNYAGRESKPIEVLFTKITSASRIADRIHDFGLLGGRDVEQIVVTAALNVRKAVNQTIARLKKDSATPEVPVRTLFALAKFPTRPGLKKAVAAEIFEETVRLALQNLEPSNFDPDAEVMKVANHLTEQDINDLRELAGCDEHQMVPDCEESMCFHKKFRSIDGTCNNLDNPLWGSATTPLKRLLNPIYENGFNEPVGWNDINYGSKPLPSSREVSLVLLKGHSWEPDPDFTGMLMQWGQFLDHDITLTAMSPSSTHFGRNTLCRDECTNAAPCFPIRKSTLESDRLHHDEIQHGCLEFIRSASVCGSGVSSLLVDSFSRREQINSITSFIDASNVYGSDLEKANYLRMDNDPLGRLKMRTEEYPKGMLPFSGPASAASVEMDCRGIIGWYFSRSYSFKSFF